MKIKKYITRYFFKKKNNEKKKRKYNKQKSTQTLTLEQLTLINIKIKETNKLIKITIS